MQVIGLLLLPEWAQLLELFQMQVMVWFLVQVPFLEQPPPMLVTEAVLPQEQAQLLGRARLPEPHQIQAQV